jgi:putative ABC transport system permease protein
VPLLAASFDPGLRRGDVMLQYLIESATMALGGGFIGVIAGVAFAKAITLIHWLSF